jgi:CO/xanthine dehydrogenase Mo-binding subunit
VSDALLGHSVPRLEDQRFLTGAAKYADDLNLEGQLYGVVVRSTHAHAQIAGIDIEAARAVGGDGPGTLRVGLLDQLATMDLETVRAMTRIERL